MSYLLISKNPVNTLLFAIYFSFLDIKQTVSTVLPDPTKLIVSTFLMFLRIFYNQLLYLENLFELLEVNL